MLVPEDLVGLHRNVQLQLLQHYWSGHRLTMILNGLPWKRTETILLFLRWQPSTALQTFSCCPWASQGKNTAIGSILQWQSGLPFPFPVDHILSDLSTWPVCLGWPQMEWLSFIELDKVVVYVIRLAVVCDCGFHPSALWRPLTVPTILLGFLLPWMWGVSSWLLQQSVATTPYLGHRVAPLGCCSWPWTWGSSHLGLVGT